MLKLSAERREPSSVPPPGKTRRGNSELGRAGFRPLDIYDTLRCAQRGTIHFVRHWDGSWVVPEVLVLGKRTMSEAVVSGSTGRWDPAVSVT